MFTDTPTFYDPLTRLIDGKGLARAMTDRIKCFIETNALAVGLAIIRVGDDPASQVYVQHKREACAAAGIVSSLDELPSHTSFEAVCRVIHRLNADPSIHGILLQLPLPSSLEAEALLDQIDPIKDVDGLTLIQQGRLFRGQPDMIPCTPKGCILLLHQVYPDLKGLNIGVVGRSMIVGRPLASVLTMLDATVTHVHSQTRNLEDILKRMDVIISATGVPGLIKRHHVREGASVIDVGIHRVTNPQGVTYLVGDVDADDDMRSHVRALTPVPGGVGPMTIACLLDNATQRAARVFGLENGLTNRGCSR